MSCKKCGAKDVLSMANSCGVCANCAVTCPGCGGRHNEDWFHKCDNCGYKLCKYCVESRCPECRTGQFR